VASFPHEHEHETAADSPRLARARPDEIASIYRQSHALWGAGLALADYRGLWDDLHRTAWGSRHAEFCVWVRDGERRVLSSLKLYRPRIRIAGETGRATVLGAVFTPPALRGRSHASAMVAAALDLARRRGDVAALLFTDIGTAWYGSFGFTALPAEEQWGVLSHHGSASGPGWTLDAMEERDLPAVMEAWRASSEARPLAFLRDREHWEFLRVRSVRFFARLADPDLRQRWIVARRDGRFAGYLVTVEGRGEWNVREVGSATGDAASMAEIVRVGAARAWREGLRGFYGWLPPSVAARLRDAGVRSRSRSRAQPMVLPLVSGIDPGAFATAEDGFIPFQDQF
jgi:GNAT superfamily N-acetyltransferase